MAQVPYQPLTNGVHDENLSSGVAHPEDQLIGMEVPLEGDVSTLESQVQSSADITTIPGDPHISNHIFYLLTDSALPLGSFAYSSGLESFIEHRKHIVQQPGAKKETKSATQIALLDKFLCLSVEAVAFSNVPYLLAAFRNPTALQELDNDLDASTLCKVAGRASQSQGKALLRLWKECFAGAPLPKTAEGAAATKELNSFVNDYGHLAPLWGVMCLATGQDIKQAAYVFLLNHARTVISAAVRMNQSYIGQFHQYAILGGAHGLAGGQTLRDLISDCLSKVWYFQPEDAGQVVPSMDLWIGRHDLLYTRVFNS